MFLEIRVRQSYLEYHLFNRDLGTTRLATETRVLCLDDESRRRFRLYWLFIGPFSGLIRRKILRSIKHEAERSPTLPDSEAS
jgi:hypothetical protein